MGEFYTKLGGVSHANADGSSRQILISRYCHTGMPLIFKPEPDNPVDPNAVGVWVKIRFMYFFRPEVQIGYVPAELAEEFAETLAEGKRVEGWIANVTGGTRDKRTRGVNVLIRKDW